MPDNSLFRIDNKYWKKALLMKLKSEKLTWIEFTKIFIEKVKTHWKKKTIPTKYSWDDEWEREYHDMSELAKDVLYPYIRAYLMAFTLGGGKVIALSGKDEVKEISNKGVKRKKFSKWLEEVTTPS